MPFNIKTNLLKLYQRLLWIIAVWSLLTIFLSAYSLSYVWQNPAYGGFLWAYESITRLYQPADTYLHPSLGEHITLGKFILQVDDRPAHPQTAAAYFNDELWPHCPTPPEDIFVTYTIRDINGEVSTTPPLPLHCFNVSDLLFNLLAVLPSALFFWLTGLLILRNAPQQQDDYEQAFGLTSAFVLFGMAAFVGRQVYVEVGIETLFGWGMILGTLLPTAVLLPAVIWANVLLVPPALARQWHPESRPWGFLLVAFWAIAILSINFILFYPEPLLSDNWLRLLVWIHPGTWLLINFGMLFMGFRGWYVARHHPDPFYQRQGLAIAGAIVAGGIIITMAVVQNFFDWHVLNFFPPQDLLIILTSIVTLGVSFGLLNSHVLPQSSRWAQRLPLFGLVAVSSAMLSFAFNLPSVGLQFAGALCLIVVLVVALRGDHRWKKLLDRLSNYRAIPAEGVETFLRQTSQPQMLPILAQTVVTQLVDLLKLRGASLWLLDQTTDEFVLYSTHYHFPSQDRLPLSVRYTLEYNTAVFPSENQTTPKFTPLDNGDECVGLLILIPSTSQLHFNSRADQEAFEAVAAHTALVINRAQAIAEARQTAVQEQDIRLTERADLGRTLHDVAVQDLNAILMSLWFLKENPDHFPRIEDSLSQAITTLRDLSSDLSADDQTGLALTDKLDKLIAMRREQYPQTHFQTTYPSVIPDLPVQQAQDFWLACRQAVDNALKHAAPSSIEVKIVHEMMPQGYQAEISFIVTDNGRGFVFHSTAELLKKGHNGLYNMESRLQRHDGTLTIRSSPEQGTIMVGSIPVLTEA